MHRKTALGGYIQLGNGPDIDPEEVDEKVKLFLDMAKSIDGEKCSPSTAVAFAALKVLCEQMLGFQVDVGIRHTGDKPAEEVKQEIKEEYERTGTVKSDLSGFSPTGTTFH